MAARVEQIDRWLAPSRQAAIIRAVGLVRGAMAVPAGASDDVFSVFVEVLKPFPEPVVEDVCRKFLDGRLGNRVYAPTPAEIAHECRLSVADALAERGRIMLVLDAEIYSTPSESEKAKLAEEMAAFAADMAKAARDRSVAETGTAHADRLRAQSDLRDLEAKSKAPETQESAA